MKLLPHRGEPIGSSKEETASYRLSGSSEIVGILRKSSKNDLSAFVKLKTPDSLDLVQAQSQYDLVSAETLKMNGTLQMLLRGMELNSQA